MAPEVKITCVTSSREMATSGMGPSGGAPLEVIFSRDFPRYLALPALTLVLGAVPYISRVTRAALIEVLETEHVVTVGGGPPEGSTTATFTPSSGGLSMGGGHTMDIGFANLDDYGYLGVFSSGVFSITTNNDWEKAHLATLDDKKLKAGLKLVWFSTGTDDMLIPTTRATVDLLKKHGFSVNYTESTGGHTWTNWREYLHGFAPLLFK